MTFLLTLTLATIAGVGIVGAAVGAMILAPVLIGFAVVSVTFWGTVLVSGTVYRKRIKTRIYKALGRPIKENSGNSKDPNQKNSRKEALVNIKDNKTKWRLINKFSTVEYLSDREKKIIEENRKMIHEERERAKMNEMSTSSQNTTTDEVTNGNVAVETAESEEKTSEVSTIASDTNEAAEDEAENTETEMPNQSAENGNEYNEDSIHDQGNEEPVHEYRED